MNQKHSKDIDARLQALGITLPNAPTSAANYVPFVQSGNLVFISGQLPMVDGKLTCVGQVGAGGDDGVSLEQAIDAARVCALNLISQLKPACDGDLDRVVRVVRLGGFVASDNNFTDQPKVINGASDLMVDIFGDAGRHARAAVGVNTLPLGAAVEVEGLFVIN